MNPWRTLRRSQRGQAFTELAMVIFLFLFFVNGITQVVMLGKARLQCEQAARQGAWLAGMFNHANFEEHVNQLRLLYPGFEDYATSGSREDGMAFTIWGKVRPVGFFRWLRPDGFEIKARSVALSYNPKPVITDAQDASLEKIMEIFNGSE